MTVGVALLQVFRNDDLGIIRVLGAAPQIDVDRFRVEAAVAKAATDPTAAVDDALLLPANKTAAALTRIAAVWARADVHGALAYVDYLEDSQLRESFRGAILQDWSLRDPDALLDYVLDLPPDEQNEAQVAVTQAFTLLSPARALEAAESLSGQLAVMARRAALMSLANDDPLAALRHAEGLPQGPDRQQLLSAVATAYGRIDPDAAIAWARAQAAPELLTNVVAGIARAHPERGLEIITELPDAQQQQMLVQTLTMTRTLRSEQLAALANRLSTEPNRGSALQMLTNRWAQQSPADALEWLLANPSRATPSAIAQAGMSLARTNPAAAVGQLDRIPHELRGSWIRAAAAGYAQSDPRGAAGWIAQYRGEPGYDAGLAAVAARMAAHDAIAAARLFESIDLARAPDAPSTASQIAATWARTDTLAAASWARELSGDAANRAVAAVAGQWVRRDAVAARGWALGLPMDAARDAALVQVLGATAGTPAADRALIDAFSSSAAQQRGIGEAVRIVAARDPAAARQLVDQHVTDPGVRQAAQNYIEQGPNAGNFGPPPRLAPTR
jgi:hypothetical protein